MRKAFPAKHCGIVILMSKNEALIEINKLNETIDAMAAEMSKDLADDNPLFVALLRGAAPFASKLMFSIQRQNPGFHPELDYMMVSTYGGGRIAGEPRIVTDLGPETIVNERTVVILDDVLDQGITAHFVKSHLKTRGAKDVKLAVLVNKMSHKVHEIEADYCGAELEDVWLVGMGMDDASTAKEYGRWQEFIEAKLTKR
jgi:hypoxanthine phosphoribosyltransferase